MFESPGFNPDVFPYVFECGECGEELHVTHEEAERAAHAGTTIREAVETVRRSEGWWVDIWDVKCPECMSELPSNSDT